MTVRLRMAPSPTGELHVGNARTALFNWLYARRRQGVFIVRVDDTDRLRSTPAFEEENLGSFRWLGLDWDEGVRVGGPHGTYRQSDRFGRYQEVSEQLVAQGNGYRCFCTPEDLEERRKASARAGRPPGYDGRCRAIPSAEAAERHRSGEDSAIRLKIPRPGETVFRDLVRGEMRFSHDVVEDFVLLRSDGSPTYHLASTVDDVDYEITHVARGEDLLSSTPKHIQLTISMGAEPPTYAHMPLLFGPDAKKLSKRHGVISVTAYREAGYLPEALFNYLGLLGWSYDAETTIFSADEAIDRFDLADVSKNPAVFDPEKLTWMNGEYLRALDPADFADRSRSFLQAGLGEVLSQHEWDRYLTLAPDVQERVKTLGEVAELAGFLFGEGIEVDERSWSKVMEAETARPALVSARQVLSTADPWEPEVIEEALRAMLEEHELSARRGLQPIRVAVTGSHISPPLFESLAALGRDVTLARIDKALERL